MDLRDKLKTSRFWTAALLFGSVLNMIFAWPTVWNAWHTQELGALSLSSNWMLLYIQLIFAGNGWVREDKFLQYSGIGAAVSMAAILLRLYAARYGWY